MDLVERYLGEVGRRVPASKRSDVVDELRSAILDAIEGRGAHDEDDVVAVLREFGDPAVVAASYDPAGQYLIGPELYPSFMRVLRLVVIVSLLLNGLAYVARTLLGPVPAFAAGSHLIGALEGAFETALFAAFIVFVVFFFIQRSNREPKTQRSDWDPRALPALLDSDRAGRIDAAFSLAATAIMAVIIGAIGQNAARGIRGAPEVFQPVVEHALLDSLPILMAALVLEALVWVAVLVDGRWRGWTRVVRVIADLLGAFAFVNAAFAVMEQWEGLINGGVPERVPAVTIATLWVIVASIVLDTTVREVRAMRARRRESAGVSARSWTATPGAGRSTPPTAPAATA